MKTEIIDILKKYFEDEKYHSKIEVFKNINIDSGEYSTNIALKISRDFYKAPVEFAKEIKNYLDKNYSDVFSEVTITNPGFINFTFNNSSIIKKLLSFAKEGYNPQLQIEKQSINYEFVSANPTGKLHIGHARNAIVGDVFINLLSYLGHDVVREYYINDAGNQINNLADSIFYYYQKLVDSSKIDIEFSKVTYHGPEIKEYASELYQESENFDYDFVLKNAKAHFLKLIDITLKKLGLKDFDVFTSEQGLFDDGKVDAFIERVSKTPYFYFKDGAYWLRTSRFGDDKDRVLKKSDNSLTYMVADVANHIEKYNRNFDLMINLWGSDHHGYEKRIKAALEILGYDSKKLLVDYISMVKIADDGEEVKMSKRKGNALTIDKMLEILDKNILRFNMLSKSKEQNLIIELNKLSEKNINNPYWYVQYVNARINNIFKKFKLNDEKKILTRSFTNIFKTNNEKEINLIKKLLDFDNIMNISFKKREPNLLLNYLKELASVFHSYYGSCKIISNDKTLTNERISLIIIFNNLYQIIFNLLGIDVIKEM